MTPDDQILHDQLSRDEGREAYPYKDTGGVLTVGVGHNMSSSPLPDHWAPPLTSDQIETLLDNDIGNVFLDLDREYPWWRQMTEPRQRALANMCFNLGIVRLAQFKNTLAAMEAEQYAAAASGMLASKWAGQVGQRAVRLAVMMRTGV